MTDTAVPATIEGEVTEEGTVAAIAVRDETSALVEAAPTQDVVRAYRAYQELSGKLLDANDYQTISNRKFKKKSAWRKLSVAYNVTLELQEKVIHRDDDGRVVYAEFVVRATAPNGRYADGWGECSRSEKCCPPRCTKRGRHKHCPAAIGDDCPGWTHFSHANHDIPATAMTRASNRAASDLFGMGEVSAEEILGSGEKGEERSAPARPTWPQLMHAYDSLAFDAGCEKCEEWLRAVMGLYGHESLRKLEHDDRELYDRLWAGLLAVLDRLEEAGAKPDSWPPVPKRDVDAIWIEQFPELVDGVDPKGEPKAEPEGEGERATDAGDAEPEGEADPADPYASP